MKAGYNERGQILVRTDDGDEVAVFDYADEAVDWLVADARKLEAAAKERRALAAEIYKKRLTRRRSA